MLRSIQKEILIKLASEVEELEEIDIDIDVLLEEMDEDDIGSGDSAELIIYNDDVNTFDWVIKCLIEVLNYPLQQAEQLTLLVHYKGKATVKTASRRELRPIKDALVDRGLSAVIEGGSGEES